MATQGFSGLTKKADDNNLTVRIIVGTTIFKGILVEDFSLNGTSSWSGDTSSGGMAQSMLKVLSDSKVQTAFSSTVAWDGSERPTFTVNMIVPALHATDDVTSRCKPLYDLVYPQAIGAVAIDPPLGFHTNAARTAVTQGAVMVAIGTWFRAPGLVASEVTITYSKQTTKKHKPLYAAVSVTFLAAVLPSAGTVKNYFL